MALVDGGDGRHAYGDEAEEDLTRGGVIVNVVAVVDVAVAAVAAAGKAVPSLGT